MWETFGIAINSGPFGINSHRALVGAKVAEAAGATVGAAYHENTLRAYWTEAADISATDTLRAIAVAAGLDGAAFVAALDDPQYEQQVQHDILLAHRFGFGGVPALLFEQKYYVAGAQPVEVLRSVVEQIQSGSVGDDSEA